MDKQLEIEEVDLTCPHCYQKISEAMVCACSLEGIKRYIYFCSLCKEPIAVKSYPRAFALKNFNKTEKEFNG